MPLRTSPFAGNLFSRNGHFETIMPALLRKVNIAYQREEFTLPDGDFIDLDFLRHPATERLLVLFHGLEGSSQSQYIKGMARHFFALGWDVCAVNFRSCSGRMNALLRSYHSGATEDVEAVMNHLASLPYNTIAAGGFSLGGNALLKYLGEPSLKPPQLQSAFAFSVPVDLAGSSREMALPHNAVYMRRFLKSLTRKMRQKAKQFPGKVDLHHIDAMTTFAEFDSKYTAPMHGFNDADDYYSRCNALQYLQTITIPTLLVNAANDPFLSDSCYPHRVAADHPNLYFERPDFGGHVGFSRRILFETYWSERYAAAFVSAHNQLK